MNEFIWVVTGALVLFVCGCQWRLSRKKSEE